MTAKSIRISRTSEGVWYLDVKWAGCDSFRPHSMHHSIEAAMVAAEKLFTEVAQ
jgi:hypothetical protein